MLPTKFRWQPCLLTDRDEMSNLHRGHSIDDSYQVSVVAMFVNDRDGMNNLHRGHSIDDSYQGSVVAMFINDRDGMSNLHRGHSIDAYYQVSVHLAKRCQRRRLKKISQSERGIACGSHVW